MDVTICLRHVLQIHNLDRRGIIATIAKNTGIDRRVVGRYYKGDVKTISAEVLGALCDWLVRHGVPADTLPGALLSSPESELWPTIASKKQVNLYMGTYQHLTQPAPAWRSVSCRDAVVAADFVRRISNVDSDGVSRPEIRLRYIPLRFPLSSSNPLGHPFDKDIVVAARVFNEVLQNSASVTPIFIGSQRVNYLLEYYIAALFGCKPFQTPTQPRVPLFFVYRQTDHKTPSCFGGLRNPFYKKRESVPGLHYLHKNGRWTVLSWDTKGRDAGVVITTYQRQSRTAEIAVFGFSGRATEAIGRELILRENSFWPPSFESAHKDVGVYICDMLFDKPDDTSSVENAEPPVCKCNVTPLDDGVLRHRLAWLRQTRRG